MKRNKRLLPLLLVLAALMSAGCSKEEPIVNPIEHSDLKEPIETGVQEYTQEEKRYVQLLSEKTQTMADGTVLRYVYYYDENGILTKADYSRNDELPYPVVYECDERGNILKETLKISAKKREVTQYVYDDADRETERWVYSNEELVASYLTEYSEDGLSAVVTEYIGEEAQGQTLCTYDQWGKLLEEKRYDKEGTLCALTEYAYDKTGNCTGSVTNSADGELEHEYRYLYDTFDLETGMFRMER